MLALAAVLGCTVDGTGESSFGDVTGSGSGAQPQAPMRDDGSGSDGAVTAATAQDSGSEDEGADDECAPGEMCISAVPEEWFGPVAVHQGAADATPPECADRYPNAGLTLMSGYNDPGPAQCECTCNLDVTTSCYSYAYDMAGCSTYEMYLVIMSECTAFDIDGGAYFSMFQQGTPSCDPEVVENIPEPVWDAQVTSCRDPELGAACEGGVCTPLAPEGFDSGVCIYREGAHACPAGDFSVAYTHHSGVADDRTCSYCACGAGTGTCAGNLDVFTTDDCTGAAQQTAMNTCNAAVTGGHSIAINFTGEGNCPVAMPSMPMGEIAAMGEFTFCCTE